MRPRRLDCVYPSAARLGPTDPATIALASITLILVSLAVGFLPVFRTSRVDPLAVLRE